MSRRARRPRLLLTRGYRPPLTIDKILAWADQHHEATGRWPMTRSGRVRDSPYEDTWAAVQSALSKGLRGLPGGISLSRLLAERRGVRAALTIDKILAWADAHHEANGEWPTQMSGPVAGPYRETWHSIDANLRVGGRGLVGPMTLARLLADRRAARNMYTIEPLAIDKIVAWADAHHAATGLWPSFESGPVLDAPGEAWSAINSALMEGRRGLPGGTTLTRVLVEHRGRQVLNRPPDLSVEQILAWADAYHEANGRWPIEAAGPVAAAPHETWGRISQALAAGNRGLPGGSTLARLLAEFRDRRNPKALPPFTFDQILAWADAHHAATGNWPNAQSGPVPDQSGDDWIAVNSALLQGHRGLPGGTSLARFLDAHRSASRPMLTMARISAWARAHRQATGLWPSACDGSVADAPGENWNAIDAAMKQGRRGLPGGTSLTQAFGRALNPASRGNRPPLTIERVLAWGDAYRAATGRWPNRSSGPVLGETGEKWVNIDMALTHGRRGLPSGLTLAKLFAGRSDPADRSTEQDASQSA